MTALVKYDAACRALAECKAIDEVKSWHDKAAAMQAYGRMAQDKTLEVDAAEIRIRAERRLGEMLTTQKADGGLNQGAKVSGATAGKNDGSSAVVNHDRRPKLADAGISKDLSSRAQKLAAVPESEFEAVVGEWRERVQAEGARVTTRLEKAGERAQKQQAAAAVAPDVSNAEEAFGDVDAAAEWEKAEEVIKSLTADDTKAELASQIRIRQGIEARLSQEMERNQQLDKLNRGYGKWYAELRKITGLEERSAITKFCRDAKNSMESAL